ncbi:MAG: hypothetical protein GC152_10865 [Alphaproteobacteria bacterium]|nr:hypothetical protein [Alphaproteobacteria bacterium]
MRLMMREAAAPTIALFASLSTLVCCALPALLVTIGAGAVMAGLAANVPGLVWLTVHKAALFIVAGALLLGAGVAKWSVRNAPCPIDPDQARACMRMRRAGSFILGVAAVAYVVGGFFAFFAADVLL